MTFLKMKMYYYIFEKKTCNSYVALTELEN